MNKRIIAVIFSLILLVNCATKDSINETRQAPALTGVLSRTLHVEGNKILNDNKEAVRLTGVNICSLEWNSQGDNVLRSAEEVFNNWNCNFIRLPLSQDYWFGKVRDWSTPNPPDDGKKYRKTVDDIVKLASSMGKYVELDLHWNNAGDWGKNIGQHKMPDENSLEFWIDVAKTYKNHPAVIFNLYNEPHDVSWAIWKDGGFIEETFNGKYLTYISPGLQKMVDGIRAAGANNLIIAGGLDWAYDLSGIGAGYALTDTPKGNGIVYDSHIYPQKEWNGVKHNELVLVIADRYPVIIGEIGIDPDGQWGAASRPDWLKGMLDWIDKNNLSWSAWCLHISATPNLISNWRYKTTAWHGDIVKERLLSY